MKTFFFTLILFLYSTSSWSQSEEIITSIFRLNILGFNISQDEQKTLEENYPAHKINPYRDVILPKTTSPNLMKHFLPKEKFPWPSHKDFSKKKVLMIGEGRSHLFSFLSNYSNIDHKMSVAIDFNESDVYPKKTQQDQCLNPKKEHRMWSDATEFAEKASIAKEGSPYICLKPFLASMDYVLSVATLCCIYEATGADGVYQALRQAILFLSFGGQAHLSFHHSISLQVWIPLLEKIIEEFPTIKFNLAYKGTSSDYQFDGTMGEFGLISIVR